MQPAQYPAYQPVPTQPGYGAQPMQTGPYQGQPYAPGPPPPYHMAANPGYPSSQAPYDGSQAAYPMMPPAQPDIAYPSPEKFDQLAYNPAYMQPPKTGY
ncbi:protein shisa-5-like [Rhinichthys klamathensis goyatoka]|uniref:protein shisa-5-like n=1 Tax=Rhinichthys klamathensis goyatoka TaxID=3034132 RepID=UPI0024B5063C|nr:protein shisa-5-like [Rhinichthys klamathensis goyatoka]